MNEDSQKRIEDFKNEYIELTKKYNVDFGAFPQFVPNDKGLYEVMVNMQIVDKGTLSPFTESVIKDK